VLRRFLIAAVLAVPLVSSATAARRQFSQTATQELVPGVTYTREVDFTPRGPVVLDVVTAPRPDGSLYTLQPVLSNETLAGTETLTELEQRLAAGATVVGVNGDFFNAATGLPTGIVMRGGALDSEPAAGRSAAGLAADGSLTVARVSFKGTWQGSGQRRALEVNTIARTGTTLYTPAFGPTTPAESGAVVEDVFDSFPATRPGQPLVGTPGRVAGGGGTPIPPGGAVLVSRAGQAQFLASEAPAGGHVEVRLTLTPDWSGGVSAIGGGPLLVSGGKPVFNARESFDASGLNTRNARSAVGRLADGRILLVTVEGGKPSYSVGMTSYELAVALVRLGAVTAVGLGSGAQAGMAFDGTLLTHPSGAGEAPVSDALVLAYEGVYAAPPSAAVLSPNGDGVADTQTLAYKLVRPSHVSATLTGPAGATVTLAGDDEQPGVHTLTWAGTIDGSAAPEGTWRFTVTATDDRQQTTTAQRDFALDDTLGGLAVRGAVATFTLTRPAQVVVTLERRNGIVVATVLRQTLQAGVRTVTLSGSGLAGGAYQVHVAATSSVGDSELVAPFTIASRGRH
jgi:hypothetical protein